MKTKQIPAVIMLTAGVVTSITGILIHMETMQFLKTLLVVLISFYVLGCIAKLVLDKNFKEETEEATEEAADEEQEEEPDTVQEESE